MRIQKSKKNFGKRQKQAVVFAAVALLLLTTVWSWAHSNAQEGNGSSSHPLLDLQEALHQQQQQQQQKSSPQEHNSATSAVALLSRSLPPDVVIHRVGPSLPEHSQSQQYVATDRHGILSSQIQVLQ